VLGQVGGGLAFVPFEHSFKYIHKSTPLRQAVPCRVPCQRAETGSTIGAFGPRGAQILRESETHSSSIGFRARGFRSRFRALTFEVPAVNTGDLARPGGLEPPTLGLEGEIAEVGAPLRQ
jgi:hypothetical protein